MTLLAMALLVSVALIVVVGIGGRVLPLTIISTDTVLVTANVSICDLDFRVYPEKRIPANGNWDNLVTFTILDTDNGSTLSHHIGVITDQNGEATVNVCNPNGLADGIYDFAVEGKSHLRRLFEDYTYTASVDSAFVDLTVGGLTLLAGDTSNVKDNEINSLDLATQVTTLYGNDDRNDLNQDGEVNSLDVSNTMHNFYFVGDN